MSAKQFLQTSKLRAPKLSSLVCQRQRLIDRLSAELPGNAFWIEGPPGAGKTVLANSYIVTHSLPVLWYQVDPLDTDPVSFFNHMQEAANLLIAKGGSDSPIFQPENFLAIERFARSFFRQLFADIDIPFVLVFDNYQDVGEETVFHDIIVTCLEEIPTGCHALLISRTGPPPQFARMKANGWLHHLKPEELKFNLEEIDALFVKHGFEGGEYSCVKPLQRATDGWATGLTLLLDDWDLETCNTVSSSRTNYQVLFDYFAGVVFQKQTAEHQKILSLASLLPDIDPAIVNTMCGHDQASELLKKLSNRNYFTYEIGAGESLYQFHPLFKNFLQQRGIETIPADELNRYCAMAARLLQEKGRVTESIELLSRAGEYRVTVGFIKENAKEFLKRGQFRTVLIWLADVPHAILWSDPLLLYFKGAAKIAFNPVEAMSILEKSFNLFKEQEDVKGSILAACYYMNSVVNNLSDLTILDPWIDYLEEFFQPEALAEETSEEGIMILQVMVRALVLRRPEYPQLEALINLSLQKKAYNVTIVTHYLWTGRFSEARAILNIMYQEDRIMHGSRLVLQSIMAMELQYYLIMGQSEKCRMVIGAAMNLMEESGVQVWKAHFLILGAGCSINAGDLEGAEHYFSLMEQNIQTVRKTELSYYHLAKAAYFLLRGDLAEADQHQKTAMELALAVGMPSYYKWYYLGAGIVNAVKEDYQHSQQSFEKILELCNEVGNPWFECQAYLGMSYILMQTGDDEAVREYLEKAWQLASHHNYEKFYFFTPEMLTSLCIRTLEHDIESDFVIGFIRHNGLEPENPPVHLDNWPWKIKIFTLGKFSLIIDGTSVSLTSSSKAKGKQLELLQVLLALGGRQVNENKLVDILWPDADGDRQLHTLKTTTYRLRKLLGNKEALLHEDHKLSINPACCWVDAWMFSQLAENVLKSKVNSSLSPVATQLAKKAMGIYQGSFLEDLSDEAWSFAYREKMQRYYRKMGSFLWPAEEGVDCQAAIQLGQQAIESDPTYEGFYQGLMKCYINQGLHAEALEVYQQCERNLRLHLQVSPSKSTRELRDTIPTQ